MPSTGDEGTSRAVPSEAADVVRAYLRLADDEAPGLVEGLHLVGSVALDEFRPYASDVDFLAVTGDRLDDAGMAALDRVHRRLRAYRKRPAFDGYYVTWGDLAADPAVVPAGPASHEGRFAASPVVRGPVEWHTLAQCGVPCLGPDVAALGVWTDTDTLRRWVLGNLDTYWGRLRQAGDRLPSPYGLVSLTPQAVVWCVTGLSRIHYTLVSGMITGKEGGAVHALEAFPSRWERIAREALRIRRRESAGSLYGTALHRRRDLLAFWDMVYGDAQRIGPR
ncbi:hypothetical protein [Actinoplanes sp. DH11]|uniref:hypothetical protein n=1 Tax=Actinoplanes sp. DH11 TaxID=2857011 RepID=UPI001E48F323|nr:hypothetical protein [Actinoplanes sp. DH11]